MALVNSKDLDSLGHLNEELGISWQVMNPVRVPACKSRHGFDTFPVGDGHELGLGVAIFAEALNAEGLLHERPDAGLIVVLLVLVGARPANSSAPDPGDCGLRLG